MFGLHLIMTRRKSALDPKASLDTCEPFRFFDLPREIRDHVYSYLVVRRGRKVPIIEAKSILRAQRKKVTAQRTRERLNQKRIEAGRRPIAPRDQVTEPIIHLNILLACKQLHYEALNFLYENNWFAISLDSYSFTGLRSSIDAPLGWQLQSITKLQLELQLKDSQRMNSYIDWTTFFYSFPTLTFLHIIPTFHPRYYDWARVELQSWESAHFVFRAFFRELLASIPDCIHLRLGPLRDPEMDMRLEGRCTVSMRLLRQMYDDLSQRRGIDSR
ncbi:hypothetical protein BCR34DRAFT_168536 [Clohesyomyces aquaticus]|uniref:DUF7730 domain-containing protein n=1 Tax=Clohesyomyces aquaticus TaxID=1231657 RepID=A0A1Y1YGU5_9PLEO|nr:hypothetical protein BCR34DRAFT_168536 [Clohesyomyces aquaticus]